MKSKWKKLPVVLIGIIAIAVCGCSNDLQELNQKRSSAAKENTESTETVRTGTWETAAQTPYGAYPELVTYTLGQMSGANNSNLPDGNTYDDNAYTRYLRKILNIQNKSVYMEREDQYDEFVNILVKVIQFFLCFTILIGIHEMGHFIMARVFKIRVEKFYIFFDPWFSLFKFKRGNTEYGLGWLPLGGYVKIAGMIDESMDTEQMKQPVKQDEFRAKPAWQRFLVMIAGVVMNVVLAVAIYIGICYTWGDTYFSNADAKWGYNFNEAGHKLGFHDGDRLVSIDGEEADDINKVVNSLIITESDRSVVVERNGRQVELILPLDELISMRQQKGYENFLLPRIPFLIDSVVNPTVAQLRKGDEIVAIDNVSGLDFAGYGRYLKAHAGDSVLLTVLREGDMLFEFKAPVSENGTLGVIRKGLALRTQKYTFLEAIPAGIQRTGKVISSYWDQLKMIVQPKTKMYEELGGFIAIGSIFPGDWNWEDFWLKTAFLSIILAVMNILPIPGLDGGHAIFTFWEMVTGRKVSDKVLEGAQYVGLVIILFLLLYANGNDIYRFFIK